MTGESAPFPPGCVVTETNTFAGAATCAAVDYWRRLGEARADGLPRVSDLNLMALYKIADRLVVAQVLDGGDEFRVRYWGTRVRDAFGEDATHRLTRDYVRATDPEGVLAIYRFAISASRPVRVVGNTLYFDRLAPCAFESACLPLFSESGDPERLLIAFDFRADG